MCASCMFISFLIYIIILNRFGLFDKQWKMHKENVKYNLDFLKIPLVISHQHLEVFQNPYKKF